MNNKKSNNNQLLMTLLKGRTFIVLVLLVIFFTIVKGTTFLSASTLTMVAKHVALYGILALGMTFVIITGGIDLSVGSVVGLVGMLAGGMIQEGITLKFAGVTLYFSVPVIIITMLVVGCIIGAVNGLIVTKLGVAPFIATLGTMYICRGFANLRSNGATFSDIKGYDGLGNTGFKILGSNIAGIPTGVYIFAVLAIISVIILKKLPFGWYVLAVGGNEKSARLSGIKADKIKIIVYMISGFCAAWVGMINTAQLSAAHPASGDGWEMNAIAVKSILKEETYIGHSVHNKQSNISFKNKKKVRKPQEEWYRVENTHEAIISEEAFQKVQELIASRRRKRRNGTTQIFAGLIKCADCGWSLAYGENKQNKNLYGYYHCSKNGQGLRQCSMHYIRYDVLYAYVLARLQYWSVLAQKDEDKLLKRLLNASDRERTSAKKKQTAELKKAEKRKAEVDGLFAKMYEDWSAGRITEYNFNMLSEKYQNEQKELETKIRQLHDTMEAAVQTATDAEKWIALMKQYVNPAELTAELLNTLIEKITVHEAVKGEDGSREQEVEIYYRFIGKIE